MRGSALTDSVAERVRRGMGGGGTALGVVLVILAGLAHVAFTYGCALFAIDVLLHDPSYAYALALAVTMIFPDLAIPAAVIALVVLVLR